MTDSSNTLIIAVAIVVLVFMFIISPILDKIEDREEYIRVHLSNGEG